MFNATTYFQNLSNTLKLTKDKYKFCRVSGLNSLEGILSDVKGHKDYIAVNDTDDGVTVQIGGGYFHRRVIIVFVLRKYDIKNDEDRETKFAETRLIRDKFIARLINDSNIIQELVFLDKTRIPYREVPGYFANGSCGLYFMLTISDPVSLIDNADDWEQ